jgi:hypothetical protein
MVRSKAIASFSANEANNFFLDCPLLIAVHSFELETSIT